MKLAHKLILAWSLTWLPLSGVVATTMSLCVPAHVATQQAHADRDHELVRTVDLDHCKKGRGNDGSTGALSCDNCDLCNIAHAMVPPRLIPTPTDILPQAPADLGRAAFSSFCPERLQRPPLSSPV